jgi:hypothetical protein
MAWAAALTSLPLNCSTMELWTIWPFNLAHADAVAHVALEQLHGWSRQGT